MEPRLYPFARYGHRITCLRTLFLGCENASDLLPVFDPTIMRAIRSRSKALAKSEGVNCPRLIFRSPFSNVVSLSENAHSCWTNFAPAVQ